MDGNKMMVSVIIPIYNSEKYIGDAMSSVLSQTYTNWEMIIVDDYSSDNGVNLVQQFIDNHRHYNIRLIKLKKNCGVANARNAGLDNASGKLVAFLDSDDLWKPNFLEEQIKFMLEQKAVFVFSSYERKDEKLKKEVLQPFIVPRIISHKNILKTCAVSHSTVVYDFDLFHNVRFDTNAPETREDLAFYLKILKTTAYMHGNSKILGVYRLRNDSRSRNKYSVMKQQYNTYRIVENMPFLKSLMYMTIWAFNGINKYRK